MNIEKKTIDAAQDFGMMDEDSLFVVLGKQEKAIANNPSLAGDPTLNPDYESTHMGVIDDLKALGGRIAQHESATGGPAHHGPLPGGAGALPGSGFCGIQPGGAA